MDIIQTLSVSERRACQALGQYRTTQRYLPDIGLEEEKLTGRIVELASRYGRYGYRRITAMLQQQPWQVKYTRECLAIDVKRKISSQEVVDRLFDNSSVVNSTPSLGNCFSIVSPSATLFLLHITWSAV